jgi:hypothetical protein
MATIVVEFFGLPASGKTYLCAAVAPGLRNLGWTIVGDPVSRIPNRFLRVTSKVPMVIAEYARSSRSRGLFRIAIAAGRRSLRSRLRVGVNILFVRARIASSGRRSSQELLLHDQGCAQALWSAAWIEGGLLESISWSRLTDDLDASFIVVDVAVPLELAASRARGRFNRNSPIDGPEQRQADMDRAWRVTEEVRAVLRGLNCGEVAVLASEGGGSPAVLSLVESIDTAARASRGFQGLE